MPRVQERDLTFETLHELDNGKVSYLLKRHLAQIANDCLNRPGDESKRKVILEFTAVPVRDPDTSDCDFVRLDIACRSKTPDYRTKEYEMRVHASATTERLTVVRRANSQHFKPSFLKAESDVIESEANRDHGSGRRGSRTGVAARDL